jgi:hypothetical protein
MCPRPPDRTVTGMTQATTPAPPPTRLRRLAPALGLFLLAPLVAEYLLGTISLSQLVAWPFIAPMYGGGALLVRELARRNGRGWPTIVLLAAAYGLLEAGLLDQSLFNPSYLGHDFQSAAHVPALGVSAHYALAFVVGHAVWSISVPIVLVETLVPDRRTTPWLGGPGLAVTAVLFVAGCALIAWDHQVTERFLATPGQLGGAAAAVVALVAAAFAVGRRIKPGSGRPAPGPWRVGAAGLLASSLFFARPESWLGVAMGLLLVAAMTVAVARWSRRAGWDAAHRFALAGGALLTYAWVGFALTPLMGAPGAADLIGNAVFALGALALLVACGRTVRGAASSRARPPGAGGPAGRSSASRTAAGTAGG